MFGPRKGVATGDSFTGADMARLSSSLLQVVLFDTGPTDTLLFLNGEPVAIESVDNLLVSVTAPQTEDGDPSVQAILSRKAGANARSAPQLTSLFPGTVEITGLARRIVVVGAPDGDVHVRLGLEPSGFSTGVHGLQSLSILLTSQMTSVHATWTDKPEEDLFPMV